MALTVTNLNTLQLLNIVNKTSAAQSNTLTQLSTGFRINKASDDPAGLIALENFNSELTAVSGALSNNQRADAMLNTTESAMNEISSLLNSIETLAVASSSDSSLSASEVAANQSQIDDALAAIDRIVNTTSFNGKKLLNGEQAIQSSGVTANTVDNLRVYSRGSSSSDVKVSVEVTQAASAAAGDLAGIGAKTLTAETQIVVQGSEGTQTISMSSGSDINSIAASINTAKDVTGVSAHVSGNDIKLATTGTGSDEFLSVEVLSGGGLSGGGSLSEISRQEGKDAKALVNGREVTGDGGSINYSNNGVSLAFDLGTSLDAVGDTHTFTVKTTGGMKFQLGVDASTSQTIGVDSMATFKLGGGDATSFLSDLKSGGSADLAAKSENTLKAVRKAITQVAAAKGRIGGFQKFQVQTSINSLSSTQESLTAAKSVIADTDYAKASAELNRQSVLLNSGMSLLGLANQQASQILSLLG